MYQSAGGLAALVPTGVVTVTSTVPPARSAGEVAVIEVGEVTEKIAVELEPNSTAMVPVKLVPVIVTWVAPAGRPAPGLTAATVGAASYVYWAAGLATFVPEGVVTVMATGPPARSAGEVALIEVGEVTKKVAAGLEPNATAVVPAKLVPVMVTGVAPAGRPASGLRAVIVGPDW